MHVGRDDIGEMETHILLMFTSFLGGVMASDVGRGGQSSLFANTDPKKVQY